MPQAARSTSDQGVNEAHRTAEPKSRTRTAPNSSGGAESAASSRVSNIDRQIITSILDHDLLADLFLYCSKNTVVRFCAGHDCAIDRIEVLVQRGTGDQHPLVRVLLFDLFESHERTRLGIRSQ